MNWKEEIAEQFEGDACGYYAECGRRIVACEAPGPLTDEMIEAMATELKQEKANES